MLGLALAPPLNSGIATMQCYFTLPLFSSLVASHLAKVLSAFVLLRTPLVLRFKSGDLRTVCIFGDGSEEGFVEGVDDN